MAVVTETVNIKGILDAEDLVLEGGKQNEFIQKILNKYDGLEVSITIKAKIE